MTFRLYSKSCLAYNNHIADILWKNC
jgi:hypothetical protein